MKKIKHTALAAVMATSVGATSVLAPANSPLGIFAAYADTTTVTIPTAQGDIGAYVYNAKNGTSFAATRTPQATAWGKSAEFYKRLAIYEAADSTACEESTYKANTGNQYVYEGACALVTVGFEVSDALPGTSGRSSNQPFNQLAIPTSNDGVDGWKLIAVRTYSANGANPKRELVTADQLETLKNGDPIINPRTGGKPTSVTSDSAIYGVQLIYSKIITPDEAKNFTLPEIKHDIALTTVDGIEAVYERELPQYPATGSFTPTSVTITKPTAVTTSNYQVVENNRDDVVNFGDSDSYTHVATSGDDTVTGSDDTTKEKGKTSTVSVQFELADGTYASAKSLTNTVNLQDSTEANKTVTFTDEDIEKYDNALQESSYFAGPDTGKIADAQKKILNTDVSNLPTITDSISGLGWKEEIKELYPNYTDEQFNEALNAVDSTKTAAENTLAVAQKIAEQLGLDTITVDSNNSASDVTTALTTALLNKYKEDKKATVTKTDTNALTDKQVEKVQAAIDAVTLKDSNNNLAEAKTKIDTLADTSALTEAQKAANDALAKKLTEDDEKALPASLQKAYEDTLKALEDLSGQTINVKDLQDATKAFNDFVDNNLTEDAINAAHIDDLKNLSTTQKEAFKNDLKDTSKKSEDVINSARAVDAADEAADKVIEDKADTSAETFTKLPEELQKKYNEALSDLTDKRDTSQDADEIKKATETFKNTLDGVKAAQEINALENLSDDQKENFTKEIAELDPTSSDYQTKLQDILNRAKAVDTADADADKVIEDKVDTSAETFTKLPEELKTKYNEALTDLTDKRNTSQDSDEIKKATETFKNTLDGVKAAQEINALENLSDDQKENFTKEIAELDPTSSDYQTKLQDILNRANKLDNAIKDAKKALEKDTTVVENNYYNRTGDLKDNYLKAKEELEKAIKDGDVTKINDAINQYNTTFTNISAANAIPNNGATSGSSAGDSWWKILLALLGVGGIGALGWGYVHDPDFRAVVDGAIANVQRGIDDTRANIERALGLR